MDWPQIDRALARATKAPPAQTKIPSHISNEYAEVLRRFNGVEGFIGGDHYLALWPVETLEQRNRAYSVETFAPGVTLIGTDGGDTGFGMGRDGRYVSVPLIGMSLKSTTDMGTTFLEFLERLARS